MTVVVRLPGPLLPYADGARTVRVDAAGETVGDVLAGLFAHYPALRDRVLTEPGEVRPHVNVFVGDESIRDTGELATPVAEGATVTILPAVSGG
jgi:sulfur-carrier protein